MCGINGFTSNDEAAIKRMTNATAHRGPDATGFYSGDGISLGHNRLSVIDLSALANQPMQSPDARYVLVFNGEIYNYRELRNELSSQWEFKTKSDTEVLLAGYVIWGETVLNKLRGMFAFAVWDTKEKELLLVRDQMGIKPLYYAIKDGVLYFSSELGGLIEGTNFRTLSKESLQSYLMLNYVPGPETLVQGVSKLRPAHKLRYKNGVVQVDRYWIPEQPTVKHGSLTNLREIIDASVKNQLVSDRPVGVLLSGGIDSSIVTHHARKHLDKLRTFSIDFEMVAGAESESEKFNADAVFARKTAEIYGCDHSTYTLSLSNIRTELNNILQKLDEPVANPTAVSRYLLSEWVRDSGVVVVLGGDGGDELFGGYIRDRIALVTQYFQTIPKGVQHVLSRLHPRIAKLSHTEAHMYQELMAFGTNNYEKILKERPVGLAVLDEFVNRYSQDWVKKLGVVDQFMRVDRELWLVDESLSQTDRTSMAHALETRVPLLDLEIVKFADQIYGQNKFLPWVNKKMLRDAYRGHLPDYLFSLPKRGWFSPGAKWLRDPVIGKYVQEVFSTSYYGGLSDLFNWEDVQAMFEHHVHGGGYHLSPLWNVLQLQVWAHKHKIVC